MTDWMDPLAVMLIRPPTDRLRVPTDDIVLHYRELLLTEHVDIDGAAERRWWTWEITNAETPRHP